MRSLPNSVLSASLSLEDSHGHTIQMHESLSLSLFLYVYMSKFNKLQCTKVITSIRALTCGYHRQQVFPSLTLDYPLAESRRRPRLSTGTLGLTTCSALPHLLLTHIYSNPAAEVTDDTAELFILLWAYISKRAILHYSFHCTFLCQEWRITALLYSSSLDWASSNKSLNRTVTGSSTPCSV